MLGILAPRSSRPTILDGESDPGHPSLSVLFEITHVLT